MLLTVHNLPPDIDYVNIKRIIQDLCFLKVLLINLKHEENGSSKVTVSTVDANEAAIVLRKLNGLEIEGYKLRVELGHDSLKDRTPSPSYEEKRRLNTIYNEYIKQIEPLQAPLPPRISSPSISSILGDTSPEHTGRQRSPSQSPLRRPRSRSRSSHRRHRSRGNNSHRTRHNSSRSKSPERRKQRWKSSRRSRRSRSRNERSQSPESRRKRSRTKSRSPRDKKLRSKSRHRDVQVRSSKSISRSPPRIQRNSDRCCCRNSLRPSDDEDLSPKRKVTIHITTTNDIDGDSLVSTKSDKNILNDKSCIDTGCNETNIVTEETLTIAKPKCAKTSDEKITDDFEENTKLILSSILNKPSTSNEGTTVLNESSLIEEDENDNIQADPRRRKRNISEHENNINQSATAVTPLNRNNSNTNVIITSNVLYHHNKLIKPNIDVTNAQNQSHPDHNRNIPFEQNIAHNNLDTADFQSDNPYFTDGPANFDGQIVRNMSVRDNVFYRQDRPPFNAHNHFSGKNYTHPRTNINNYRPPENIILNQNELPLHYDYAHAPRYSGPPPPSFMNFNYHGGDRKYQRFPSIFFNRYSKPKTRMHMPIFNRGFNSFRNFQEPIRFRGQLFNKAQYYYENRHARTLKKTNEIITFSNNRENLKNNVINNGSIAEPNPSETQNTLDSNSVVYIINNVGAQTAAEQTEIEPENEIEPKTERKRIKPCFNERKAKEYNKYIAWKDNQSDFNVMKSDFFSESEEKHFTLLIDASKELSKIIIQSTPKKKPSYNEYNILGDYIADKLNKLINDKGTCLEPSEDVYVKFFLDEHKEESHREFMENYYKWCSEVFYLNEDDWDLETVKTESKEINPNVTGKKRRRSKNANKNRNRNKPRRPGIKTIRGHKIGNIRLERYIPTKKNPAKSLTLTEQSHKNEDKAPENSETTNQQTLKEQNPNLQENTESLSLAQNTVIEGIDCQTTDVQDDLSEKLKNSNQAVSVKDLQSAEISHNTQEMLNQTLYRISKIEKNHRI